jgi:hypothetical protein
MGVNPNNGQPTFRKLGEQLLLGDKKDLYDWAGTGQIIITGESTTPKYRLAAAGATRYGYFAFDKARGTFADPTAVKTGDAVGSIIGLGHDNIGLCHAAELLLKVTEDWNIGAHGMGFDFYTVNVGSTNQTVSAQLGMTGKGDFCLTQAGARLGVGLDVGERPKGAGHFRYINQFAFWMESTGVGSVIVIQGCSNTGTYDYADSDANVHHKLSMNGGTTRINKQGGKVEFGANSEATIEDGIIGLKETTTPTATADYGKIYPKSDNKLYFQDGSGIEHEISMV